MRAQSQRNLGPWRHGVLGREQTKRRYRKRVVALRALKLPRIVPVPTLVAIERVVEPLLLVRGHHVVLDGGRHDARRGNVRAVRRLVGRAPGPEKGRGVLEELIGHDGRRQAGAGANGVARVRIELDGAAGRIVGEVELIAEAGSELDELFGRDEVVFSRHVLNMMGKEGGRQLTS